MPTQCRHASIPTHRFQSFGLSWESKFRPVWSRACLGRNCGRCRFHCIPRSCSSTRCSLGFPTHHWLTSIVLWSLVTDTEGRESWGKWYLLSSLRTIKKQLHVWMWPVFWAMPSPVLVSAPSVVALHVLLWVSGFGLREKWTPQWAAELSKHEWASVGFPCPHRFSERQAMRTGLGSWPRAHLN